MRVLKVIFPRNLRASFTRAAKKAFPCETFAICLGTKGSAGEIYIESLLYPPVTLDADGKGFSFDTSVYELAAIIGNADNQLVVGDIHSHPYPEGSYIIDAAPSETDWDHCDTRAPVHGVCAITSINGRKRSRYRFWPRAKSIEIQLT